MTDVAKLRRCMDDSGMKMKCIAEKAGILRETLYNRLKTGDFKISEICALAKVLNLSQEQVNAIFFEKESE